MYQPPEHLAIYNHSTLIEDSVVAFHAEAIKVQLRDHACPAWKLPVMNVGYYGHARNVPTDKNAVLAYVNDDGNAKSAGYHVGIKGGLVYALVDVGQSRDSSVTGSHEGLEILGNSHLGEYVIGPGGFIYWLELADPVQRARYYIEVTLLGQKMKVKVSDFCLPAWFGLENGPNVRPDQTTWMDQKLKPFEVMEGGYQIAKKPDGETVFLSPAMFSRRPSVYSRTNRIRAEERQANAIG